MGLGCLCTQGHNNKLLFLIVSHLQNVLFMAFRLSGLLSSTWITCSCGLVTASVSNEYASVLFILLFTFSTLICDANKACLGFKAVQIFFR